MPLFNLKCSCGYKVKKLSDTEPTIPCLKCGGLMTRDYQGVSAQQTEVLDNGFQARKVERLAKTEELVADYAESKDKE